MKLDKENMIEYLPIGKCIHITRNENYFLISNYKDGKIFFSIPNNNKRDKPYKKSLSIQLIKQIFESKNYDFKSFPYQDCRRSAAKGMISILNSQIKSN
jgi:hypothetical protein